MAVIRHALAALETEYATGASVLLFADLKSAIAYDAPAASYGEIAAKHRTTQAAVKMRVGLWRKRFGELLAAELAKTVATPEDVIEELRALLAAVS